MTNPECGSLNGMDDVSCDSIDDLRRNPTSRASDYRFPFPHGFRNGQAEPFLDGLLERDGGAPLQGVDFKIRLGRELDDMNIGVVARRLSEFCNDRFAFRVMHDAGAGQYQLAVLVLFHKPKGLDGPEGVFKAVEPADL